MNDSGCQLCAVNAETVRSLDLPVFGQVKLRGISDRHLVPADVVVVKIRVRLTTGKEFVNITCAAVEKLNYPIILGSDIVDKLNKQLINESFVVTEMMNVVNENDDGHVNDGDDDDDDDNAVDEHEVTNDKCDKHESENVNMSDPRKASAEILRRDHEQLVLPVNRRPEVMKLAH